MASNRCCLSGRARAVAAFLQVERGAFWLGAGCLLVVMVITLLDVTGRYFLASPLSGTLELARMLLGATVCLSWGYTQRDKAHVSIDEVVDRLSERWRRRTGTISMLLCLLTMVFVAWRGTLSAFDSLRMNEVTDTLGLSMFPAKVMVGIGALVLCARFAIDAQETRRKKE